MALPFAALSLGVSAAGAAGNLWSAFAGARARERETAERVRRFEADAAQTLGETRARGAASGAEFESSSLQEYIRTMSDEFRRQARWMRETGETEADLARTAGVLNAAAGVGGALLSFGQASNWWREPMLRPRRG